MKKEFYRIMVLSLVMVLCLQLKAQNTNYSNHRRHQNPKAMKCQESVYGETEQPQQNIATRGGGGGGLDPSLTTHKVIFNFSFDENEYRVDPGFCNICNSEVGYVFAELNVNQFTNGENIVSVPEGTYDIAIVFEWYDPSTMYGQYKILSDRMCFVIKEQVDIYEDGIVLSFSPEDAKNHIHFQTSLPNGTPVYTGEGVTDDNWNVTMTVEGNVDEVETIQYVIHKDFGLRYTLGSNFGITIPDVQNCAENFCDFYVNDVSDKYAFHSLRFFYKDGLHYCTNYEVLGATKDTILTNKSEDFVLYEELFKTDLYENTNCPAFTFYSRLPQASNYRIVNLLRSSYPLNEGETFKVYMQASPENSQVGMLPYLIPFLAQETEDGGVSPLLESMPIIKLNGTVCYMNNGSGTRNYGDLNIPDMSFDTSKEGDWNYYDVHQYFDFPSNPISSYPVNLKDGILGNNCPILISRVDQDKYFNGESYEYYPYIFFTYMGRHGELISNQVHDAEVWVKLDDIEVGQGKGNIMFCSNEEFDGTLDVMITNNNVRVDDLQGKNVTHMVYEAAAVDHIPPTMQMLNFRNEDGVVTDRFDKSSDGIFELYAGDFNYYLTEMSVYCYDRYAPLLLEISYSPYNEEEWKKLTVEEDSEKYWPTMGWYYTGTLQDVTGTAEKGWFDLKIRLEDEAGNWQEQVISPAFRINDLVDTGIENMEHSTWNIEHAEAVYDVMGRHVGNNLSTRQLANSSTSNKGIRIVRKANGDVRKVVAK